MSDAKSWIEERRAIHRDGWSGKWSWSLNDRELATLRATGSHVDFDLIRDDEFRGPSEVLDEIIDAHNVTVPRALNALEAVLEVLDAGVRDGDSAEVIRRVAMIEIEGAINHE